MFNKRKKESYIKPMPHAPAVQRVQRHSDSSSPSSHALVPQFSPDKNLGPGHHLHPGYPPSQQQYEHQAAIPMQSISRQHLRQNLPHQNHNNKSSRQATQGHGNLLRPSQKIVHEPPPPPVDFSGVAVTSRYQFRALSRRALSYHVRQRSTNLCCLVIWPVMLVLACFVFSLVGTATGDIKGESNKDGWKGMARFCVNEADPQRTPVFSLSKLPHPREGASDGEGALNVGWYPSSFKVVQDMGDWNGILPCVRWFGETYPIGAKSVYENATAADAAQPDSYYTPPPTGGWFNLRDLQVNFLQTHPGRFNDTPALWSMPSINQTVYYATANAQIAMLLGLRPDVTHAFTSETWPLTNAGIVTNASARPGSGIFGAMPVRYASSFKPLGSSNATTYYTSGPCFIALPDQRAMDKVTQELIIDLSVRGNSSSAFENMPFGSIFFGALDVSSSNLKLTLQFGLPDVGFLTATGKRNDFVASTTPPGLRQIITMTQLSQALVKTKFGGQYRISQGVRALPFEWHSDELKGLILNRLSTYLFPFGLSVLLPTLVAIMVTEKENRHRMMMAMNGLNAWSYFLGHYLEFLTMQLIVSLFFAATCVAIQSQVIWRTSPWITSLLFLLWAHVQTTMALVLSSVFSNTRKATMIVYFFVAVSCIMISVSEKIFKDETPFVWYIHPSFAFFNILTTAIRHASRVNGLYPLMASDFAPGTLMFKTVMMLIGESILFLMLTFYLDAVAPSEYGVQKPWHFPVTCWLRKPCSDQLDLESSRSLIPHHGKEDTIHDELKDLGDADAYAEHERVYSTYQPSTTPLIIKNLFHRYQNKVEPALRGLSLGVENNTVIGLLGPNGAGKSTLIHLLTGLYSPTSGTAFVAGLNIRRDMSLVQSKMGVCPQHDILWDELTVTDHLLFYSRLRGIPPRLENQAVDYALASVSLTRFRDRLVRGLSGGEKRRVSIAIALMGDKQVIFLDEPSTGLDPEVRRIIWEIVQRVKIGRTIVLTTHSMEEADILSDKIAIMTSGRLRCMGTSLHLKELYGKGFKLDVTSKVGRLEEACKSVEQNEGVLKGRSYKRVDKFTNSTTFEFELERRTDSAQGEEPNDRVQGHEGLSAIFASLSQPGMFPAIEDWGLSQTTLEDVFIRIVTSGPSGLQSPRIVSHESLLRA